MKNKQFLAIGIMMLMPLTILAQGNIKRTFNVLITSDYAKVESSHKLNKDPETGSKIGQLDVYEFTIPASHHDLVEDIERAFDQDKEKAYSLSSASTANKRLNNYSSLAVGGFDYGYRLGNIKDSRYIYALFLDPEDKSKTHRYAYAMEWRKGTKETIGKLVITYATTLQHRESNKQSRIIHINGNDVKLSDNGFSFSNGSESWLSQFNTYKNLFTNNPEGTAANYYASFIYKLCKKADSLDDLEKQMVIKELEKLRKVTKDEFIQNIFETSIERLKK